MFYTESEVITFINESDIKFIRLAFCDIFGVQKNVSIMPSELPRAFETGISFDASAIKGFGDESKSDLFLFPDPSTLSLLPWRPSHGRVVRFFCDIKYSDGSPFALDGRYILKQAVAAAKQAGFLCNIGAECEFYLFKTDEDGNPTQIPFDNAGYMDIAPKDKGENVRREICLSLEEMGILPESSHHEEGPGQNEIDFKYSNPLSSADNVITFQSVVKTIASRNGLYATFRPKPLPDQSGNGLHINLSPQKIGSPFCEQRYLDCFMAGIMNRICEITAFLNPCAESYRRLGTFKAPRYVSWSPQNRSHLIRIPAEKGEYSRIELRSPDSMANPYLAYALLIQAGLEGIQKGLLPGKPLHVNLYTAPEQVRAALKQLPQNLEDAIKLAGNSEFVSRILTKYMVDAYRKEISY